MPDQKQSHQSLTQSQALFSTLPAPKRYQMWPTHRHSREPLNHSSRNVWRQFSSLWKRDQTFQKTNKRRCKTSLPVTLMSLHYPYRRYCRWRARHMRQRSQPTTSSVRRYIRNQ
ncbi:unnamed protein product [Mycena citricolor]|uniref:Uncharacterized protein n=1 Tax=Mycena citricolor TaxID=2018698 RepID=A0AAD2K321_9AGAR|nr:unnamed protein product [Mycena citricolor]